MAVVVDEDMTELGHCMVKEKLPLSCVTNEEYCTEVTV